MDLSNVRAKLQTQNFAHYQTFNEFVSDCRLIFDNCAIFNEVSTCWYSEALELRLAHNCWSLSRFLSHEAARSISTSPGRDASPSLVTSLQFIRFPQQFGGTHL